MLQNPYDPISKEGGPNRPPHGLHCTSKDGRNARLSVFAFNIVLVLLFPPICCPCGLGILGLLIQPYMLLLAFPPILAPMLGADLHGDNRAAFLAIYLTNYVVVAYLMGELVGRLVARRRQRAVQEQMARGE